MTPEEMLQKLGEPFPKTAIKQRQADGGSGRMLDYVEGHTVIRRLNDATNGTWDFHVTAIDSTLIGEDRNHNPRLLWKVRGALNIPGLGTRENIGVQVASLGTGEDLLKGAITDCIKRCATLFGVGLELYGPDYESGEITAAPAPRAAQPAAQTPMRSYGEREVDNRGTAYPASEKQINFVKLLASKKRGWDTNRLAAYLDQTFQETIVGLSSRTAKRLIDEWKDLPEGGGVTDEYADAGGYDEVRSWNDFYIKWKPEGIHNLQDVARRLGCTIDEVGDDPVALDARLTPPPF